jgi:trigger factor
MQVTVEKVDDINYIFKGTVENSVIEAKVAKLKEQAAADSDTQSLTPEKFEQDAAGEAFGEFIDAGMKESQIPVETLLGQPGLKKYERQGDSVYFEVDVATSPTVNCDIDLSDVIPSYTKPTPDPKAVEEKLEEFAAKHAPFIKIDQPRAVENGDIAVIDFKGFLNGEAFEGGAAQDFKLKVGSNSFIPGFEEQIIGMEYNEERTIKVTFPEDYQSKELAGQETTFEIKLHEIQEQKPVTPDDAFAQGVLSDPKATLDTLKEKLGDQVTADEISELYNQDLRPKLIEGLLSKFDFTLPNNIVEQEIDAKVREKVQGLSEEEQKANVEDKDKFFELRNSVRQEAQDGIKIALIVEALAKKEGIEVDEQEVIAALTHRAMMAGQDPTAVVNYYKDNNLMTSAKLGLTEDKLFGQMLGFNK